MAPLTDKEALEAAKSAQHDLLTGGAVAEFKDQNGETVRYTTANRFALASYINSLEAKVSGGSAIRPMTVTF